MRRKPGCTAPNCCEPRDPETQDTLCSEHSHMWRQSEQFQQAFNDPDIRFLMSLRCERAAMSKVAKYRRKWAKTLEGA